MSFQMNCPNCGLRPVWEFHYGGPSKARPAPDAGVRTWSAYLYDKPNPAGVQTEWWYHRSACKLWFTLRRDTRTNQVIETRPSVPAGAGGQEVATETASLEITGP